MLTITHTHRTTYERQEGTATESAEIAIHIDVRSGPMSELEIIGVEVLCAPGTGIGRRRPAPPHIWSWAETYCLDHASELRTEASVALPTTSTICTERRAA